MRYNIIMTMKTKKHHDFHHDAPDELIAGLLRKFAASHLDDTVIVAVCGPGGSGKSTFCRKLQKRLPHSSLMKLDDYNTPRHVRAGTGLLGSHPEAVKLDY